MGPSPDRVVGRLLEPERAFCFCWVSGGLEVALVADNLRFVGVALADFLGELSAEAKRFGTDGVVVGVGCKTGSSEEAFARGEG